MKVTHRDWILLLSRAPIFMIQPRVKIGKLAPCSDPYVLQLSKPKSNGQSQDIETTTDLAHNDSSEKTPEPSTDSQSACKPMPPPTSRQSENTSTLEINDPTTETIPQKEPSCSRGGKHNLRPNPNPNYSEIYRY